MFIIFEPDDALPCPFCEGEGSYMQDFRVHDREKGWYVVSRLMECPECQGQGVKTFFIIETEDEEDEGLEGPPDSDI